MWLPRPRDSCIFWLPCFSDGSLKLIATLDSSAKIFAEPRKDSNRDRLVCFCWFPDWKCCFICCPCSNFGFCLLINGIFRPWNTTINLGNKAMDWKRSGGEVSTVLFASFVRLIDVLFLFVDLISLHTNKLSFHLCTQPIYVPPHLYVVTNTQQKRWVWRLILLVILFQKELTSHLLVPSPEESWSPTAFFDSNNGHTSTRTTSHQSCLTAKLFFYTGMLLLPS